MDLSDPEEKPGIADALMSLRHFSVTFVEMTEKSVVYFKGISSLIEAQKVRGVENEAARLMHIPESTVPPLKGIFRGRAEGVGVISRLACR